ncbi:MAG: GntR family transcriptional regulator [Pseudonocardiaceae bacterium]
MPDDTLHGQMTADLRQSITSGALQPGASLPSESELGQRYGVSRPTVRRALQTLEQEGLISAHAGRGRVVRDRRVMAYRPQQEFEPRRSTTMDRFTTALFEEGRRPSQSIEVAVESASGIIAERLGVPEGTPVVARKRIRFIDGEPFNINDTYHTLELAGGTAVMNPDDIPEGSSSVIEQLIGPEVRALDEIYVRMPTPEETRRLKLSTGTPVAIHYCTGYTQDERVVRVEYFVIPGDRHVIVYEREHPQTIEG